MPTITVSEHTFGMLQELAVPLVDSPESVIARLAEEELDRRSNGKNSDGRHSAGELNLKAASPPSLKHTRLLSASIDGEAPHRSNWNKLMRDMHAIAKRRLGTMEALRTATGANIVEGKLEDRGYSYIPEAKISVQGIDANSAWSHTLQLAQAIGSSVAVEFEWHNKEDAAHPGRRARMEFKPAP